MEVVIVIVVVVVVFFIILSKSGPIEKPQRNTVQRKEVNINLKDYPNEYVFSVSGVHLPQYAYAVFNMCKEFDMVKLIPEPDNVFDSDAIKVENSGWHIGYVPAIETEEVIEIIEKKHIAYIDKISIGSYISIIVKIKY